MAAEASDVLAVILHFNNTSLTLNCLESLRYQTKQPDVLIIDNGSTSGDANLEIFPILNSAREQFMVFERGLGYATAVNKGIRFAMERMVYRYVLLLGNDTELESNVVQRLVERMQENTLLGAVAALQVRMSDTDFVQSAGGVLHDRYWLPDHIYWGQRTSLVRSSPLPSPDWVDFAAVLIPIEVIERVGLLDERYHFYWEDLDWCLRCRQLGYGLMVDADAIVRHHVGASSGKESPRTTYYLERNRFESALRFNSKRFVMQLFIGECVNVCLRNISVKEKRMQFTALYDFLRQKSYRY